VKKKHNEGGLTFGFIEEAQSDVTEWSLQKAKKNMKKVPIFGSV